MADNNILNISKQALSNSRAAIDTTAKNIANINTEGYKRRRVDFGGNSTASVGAIGLNFQYGELNISRIREQFIDTKVFEENQNMGKYEMDNLFMPQIEGIFGEPNDAAINNSLNEFWNSWNDLSIDPENLSNRTILLNKAGNLSNAFKRVHTDLKSLQNQTSLDIEGKVNEINMLLDKIDNVNNHVKNIKIGSNGDLLDERDLLLDKLSKLMDIKIDERGTGEVAISSNGQILISGGYTNKLVFNTVTKDEFRSVDLKFEHGTLDPNIMKGELGSLIALNNEAIPDYTERLDNMAISLSREVNQVHRTGYDLDGNTGFNFFSEDITSAGNFNVDQAIELNPSYIATASDVNKSGDGTIARQISDLRNSEFMDGNKISDYYNGLISDVGNSVQNAEFLYDSQEKVMMSLLNQQDSVSGVSNDEELTNLIQYQQAYQAAAKLVSVSEDLVDVLLNMM